MMKMGSKFLVIGAAAAALEISCSMDQYALSVGVVFFYDDAALCEKTCARDFQCFIVCKNTASVFK